MCVMHAVTALSLHSLNQSSRLNLVVTFHLAQRILLYFVMTRQPGPGRAGGLVFKQTRFFTLITQKCRDLAANL
jgi:hypothetical protein